MAQKQAESYNQTQSDSIPVAIAIPCSGKSARTANFYQTQSGSIPEDHNSNLPQREYNQDIFKYLLLQI